MKNYIVRSINAEIAEISEVIEELTIAGKELLLPIYEAQWRYLAGLLSRMQKEVASAGVRKWVQVAILQESTRSQLEDLQAWCQIVRPGETFDPVWEAYTRLREWKKEGIFKPQTL